VGRGWLGDISGSNRSVTTDGSAPRMYGLGPAAAFNFRPQKSGSFLFILSFDVNISTGANNAYFQIGLGPGSGPANGTSWYTVSGIAGTGVGKGPGYQGCTITLFGTATGLGLGTLYWIDLAATSLGGTITVTVSNIGVSIVEL
jgi:hypothetical protein